MKKIAVVGATGLVGSTFLKVLEEYGMSDFEYTLLASKKSAGKQLALFGKTLTVEELNDETISRGYDIALFSAGGAVSGEFAPKAAATGCTVIDNSARWRMEPDVPLVVPEVNPEDVALSKGIIANPNCSTIQAVVALAPLHRKYGIRRIVYSTYQAVAGAGVKGVDDLENGIKAHVTGEDYQLNKFPYPIFNNCIPQIDIFLDNGYYKEEQKMVDETRKILHSPQLAVTATCVRVPVFCGHSEAINVEFEQPFDLDCVKDVLASSSGVRLIDDPANNRYPLVSDCVGNDCVYVGRVRRDFSVQNWINLWVVSDNLRKGAAANAVQIAKLML